MIRYPEINPTIFRIGFLQIRWYSLMYIIAFAIGYFFLKSLYKKRDVKIKKQDYESLFFLLCSE